MNRTANFGRWRMIGAAMLLPSLTGCSGFFPAVPVTPPNPSGNTGSSVYVANGTTSSIASFSIVAATPAVPATATVPATPAIPASLTSLSNPPFAAGYQPLSMAVTPNNSFLYVGGVSGIYLYLINSNGSLSTPAAGANQTVANTASLTISPDGQWLIALDGSTQQLDIFQINSSTGALISVVANPNQLPTYSVQSGVWQPTLVRISPDGTLIFAALGTGGDVVFSFNTSTGQAIDVQYLSTGNKQTSDFGLAVDPNTAYLYVARSGVNGGVAVFSIGSGGLLTPVKGSPFAAGNGTYSLAMDPTGAYLYAANRTDGTISGFTIVPATAKAPLTLTPISGSPYPTGSIVQSLGIDSTGKYLLAAALGGNPDLTLYSFDATTPGKLDKAAIAATDTDPAGATAIALTR